MKIVIVDLCGTLVLENTTQGFVSFLRQKKLSGWVTDIGLSRFTARAGRIAGVDFGRPLLIRSLKGLSRIRLYEEAEQYVEILMSTKLNRPVRQFLDERLAEGAQLCLATASLDPIAVAVSHYFNFYQVISSKLEYLNGICTGRLELDVRGKKWNNLRLQCHRLEEADEIVGISDNSEDTDIQSSATEFHSVALDGHLTRK